MAEKFFVLNIKQFLDHVKQDMLVKNYSPIVGIGGAGIGKTAGIYELTQILGIGYKELRLVNHTETDLIGIPYDEYNDRDSNGEHKTRFAANTLLPTKSDGEEGILVLDEITSCAPNIRALALQLLDSSRRVGDYKLPEKWKIIVLGNGSDDGAVNYQGLELPVINRCECFRIENDYGCWRDWADTHNVNKMVIAFLNFMPSMFAKYPGADEDDVCAFPTPRSWTELSFKLNLYENNTDGGVLDDFTVMMLAQSRVGQEAGTHFATFYRFKTDAPNVIELFKDPSLIAKQNWGELSMQVVHIVTQQCIDILTKIYAAEGNGNAVTGNLLLTGALLTGNASQSMVSAKSRDATSTAVSIALAIAESKAIDVAVTMITQLANSSPTFKNIVLFDQMFDQQNPKFKAFYTKNAIVFNSTAVNNSKKI